MIIEKDVQEICRLVWEFIYLKTWWQVIRNDKFSKSRTYSMVTTGSVGLSSLYYADSAACETNLTKFWGATNSSAGGTMTFLLEI